MQERSKGVLALALLSVVIGILGLVAGLALLLGGSVGAFGGAGQGVGVMVIGSILFAIGIVSFAIGAGFWMVKPWAWTGGVVVYSAWSVANLAGLLVGASFLGVAFNVALGAATVWYLLQPKVRAELVGGAN